MKYFVLCLCMLFFADLLSQDFKRFRIGAGAGFAGGLQNGLGMARTGRILVCIEPVVRITDDFAMGLRFETAGTLGQIFGASNEVDSYSAYGQYYFDQRREFRYFVGFGSGFYRSWYSSGLFGPVSSTNESFSMGVYPRIGVDYKFLTLALEAIIASPSTVTVHDVSANYYYRSSLSNNYISLKIMAYLGGGRKNKS